MEGGSLPPGRHFVASTPPSPGELSSPSPTFMKEKQKREQKEWSAVGKERAKRVDGDPREAPFFIAGSFCFRELLMFPESSRISEIFTRLRSQNPNPASELNYVNAYTLLVAVVLSAQATDKSVNIATEPLFKIVTTPEQMVALGEEKLITYIKSIGLYKTKAKHVIELSEKLISDFNSQVPQSREELMSLPGVGQKTANVVQNVIFKMPTMPVDTHIFRVSHRIGLSDGATCLIHIPLDIVSPN